MLTTSTAIASADTTLSGLQSLIGVMLLFPEAQRKAQMELDRVLSGRLPEFSDEPDLPYLTAVVIELLRWNPMAPLGELTLLNLRENSLNPLSKQPSHINAPRTMFTRDTTYRKDLF